jgi:hypothetical protein
MVTHLTAELLAQLGPVDRTREQLIDQYHRQFLAASNEYARRSACLAWRAEVAKRSPAAVAALVERSIDPVVQRATSCG